MRHATAAFALLLVAVTAAAQDLPAGPDTPEQVAEQVLAGSSAPAAVSDPDPWLVAEVLCRAGRREAALAFAREVPRPDRSRLLAWVETVTVTPAGAARAELLQDALRAFADGDRETALRVLPVSEIGDGPLAVRIENLRATMLLAGADAVGAGAALARSGAAARAAGWLEQAAADWRQAGLCAYSGTDFQAAATRWREWLAVAEELGDATALAEVLNNLGVAMMKLSDYDRAMDCYERSLALAEDRGDRLAIAKLTANMGIVHRRRGNLPAARAAQERSLEIATEIGNERSIAAALTNLGGVHADAGRYEEALEVLDRAVLLKLKLGDGPGAATALLNVAICHQDLGELPAAREALNRAIGFADRLRLPDVEARARVTLGNVALIAGDHRAARAEQERALLLSQRLGDRSIEARALGNLARIHRVRGDFPAAIRCYGQAVAVFRKIGERRAEARTLLNLGVLLKQMGSHDRASECDGLALTIMRDLGDVKGLAHAYLNYGADLLGSGSLEEAARAFDEAAALGEGIESDDALTAALLSNRGLLLLDQGRPAEAEVLYRRALALNEKAREPAAMASTMLNIAAALHDQGKVPAAEKEARLALQSASELAVPELETRAHVVLAECLRSGGRLPEALEHARLAVSRSRLFTAGLSEEEKARYRESRVDRYQLGIELAIALGSPEEAWFFLESSRAAALLETLQLREALPGDLLPDGLAEETIAARTELHGAAVAWRRVLARGNRRELGEARSRVAAAEQAWLLVHERMERELQAGAGVLSEEPAALDSVRAVLQEGDALVLYALLSAEAAALVVTRKGARIVSLGEVQTIRDLGKASGWRDRESDLAGRAEQLRELLVDPLELAEETTRLLVSPDGELAYVPFAPAAGHRPVVMVPSGSALLALGPADPIAGSGVLALGDPMYEGPPAAEPAAAARGPGLAPLPESGAEARAVGTTVLLGRQATVEGLRDGLTGHGRWRAVHLACHGLVDPERPMLSALALTPGAGDDGYLRCLDLFRMRIPADLVVLSACKTARGRVYQAEGVVGLTRAFMTAGAPRVICSLWKVDDQATKALMVKFYELWNPKEGEGLPAATALREAQEFVRGHEKWKHPYFWAAWVLWGLPG